MNDLFIEYSYGSSYIACMDNGRQTMWRVAGGNHQTGLECQLWYSTEHLARMQAKVIESWYDWVRVDFVPM
jgi:hypothetical protein